MNLNLVEYQHQQQYQNSPREIDQVRRTFIDSPTSIIIQIFAPLTSDSNSGVPNRVEFSLFTSDCNAPDDDGEKNSIAQWSTTDSERYTWAIETRANNNGEMKWPKDLSWIYFYHYHHHHHRNHHLLRDEPARQVEPRRSKLLGDFVGWSTWWLVGWLVEHSTVSKLAHCFLLTISSIFFFLARFKNTDDMSSDWDGKREWNRFKHQEFT